MGSSLQDYRKYRRFHITMLAEYYEELAKALEMQNKYVEAFEYDLYSMILLEQEPAQQYKVISKEKKIKESFAKIIDSESEFEQYLDTRRGFFYELLSLIPMPSEDELIKLWNV